jgi:hypothetical protein
MASLPLSLRRLVDEAGQLQLSAELPQTIELFAEDTADTLQLNIQHAFEVETARE